MIQALQHTSEQISIPGPVPTIQESFAAHFWTGVHMVAHDGPVPTCITRILCSSFLDRYPYGGTRRASAHMHYKNPLQLIFGPVSIWWHTTGQCPHALQESFAAHFWTGIHMVAHDGPVPTCITRILCSSFLDRYPYGGTRRASAHMHYKNPLQLIFGPVSI